MPVSDRSFSFVVQASHQSRNDHFALSLKLLLGQKAETPKANSSGVSDLCWLLDHGYGIASATELVGDRYRLSRRQRIAVARCACSSAAKERRKIRCVADRELRSAELWLDGFNVLTAVEAALGGGVILLGRDGCCRDVAGVYSHYHKVLETVPALRFDRSVCVATSSDSVPVVAGQPSR